MPALSDAEILAALPTDARTKIDNAFEALSGSLPSDKERLILYRVASALKLNPTDTHFSILAAMHYYLQLYQVIPDRIVDAGAQIIAAGHAVDETIRKATREVLTEHSRALDAQTELFASKTRSDLIEVVGKGAQRIAADTSAHERQASFVRAVGAISMFAVIFFAAGMVLTNAHLGLTLELSVALLVGGLSGGALTYVLSSRAEKHTASGPSENTKWDHKKFLSRSLHVHVPDLVIQACRDVLVYGCSVEEAAANRKINADLVTQGIMAFKQAKDKSYG